MGRVAGLLGALVSVCLSGCQAGLVLYDSAAAREREWERDYGPTIKPKSEGDSTSGGGQYGAGSVVLDGSR